MLPSLSLKCEIFLPPKKSKPKKPMGRMGKWQLFINENIIALKFTILWACTTENGGLNFQKSDSGLCVPDLSQHFRSAEHLLCEN